MRYQISYQRVRELEDKMLDSLETLLGDSHTSSVTVHSFQTISFSRFVRNVAVWIFIQASGININEICHMF